MASTIVVRIYILLEEPLYIIENAPTLNGAHKLIPGILFICNPKKDIALRTLCAPTLPFFKLNCLRNL